MAVSEQIGNIPTDAQIAKFVILRLPQCRLTDDGKSWKRPIRRRKDRMQTGLSFKTDERAYMRAYHRKRRATDPAFRIMGTLRCRLSYALKKNRRSESIRSLIGCSVEFLCAHLESQFHEGMSWLNYGQWHIDHERPCCSFDLSLPDQQRACFHWSNLQPLWATDNLRKGGKYAA